MPYSSSDAPLEGSTAADLVQFEVNKTAELARHAHVVVKSATQQLEVERRYAAMMHKDREKMMAAVEKVRADAVKQAEHQRDAAEKRLARQLASQRKQLERDMRASQRSREIEAANQVHF